MLRFLQIYARQRLAEFLLFGLVLTVYGLWFEPDLFAFASGADGLISKLGVAFKGVIIAMTFSGYFLLAGLSGLAVARKAGTQAFAATSTLIAFATTALWATLVEAWLRLTLGDLLVWMVCLFITWFAAVWAHSAVSKSDT